MLLKTLDGKEEEIEVIGSGISSSFQPAPESRPRLPLKLPNLKYNAPESSANNYSPGTSVVFNAYRGHGKLLTQPYAASSDNDSDPPPERTYQRLPANTDTPNPRQHRTHTILMAIHPITHSTIIQTTPPIALLMTVLTLLIPVAVTNQGIQGTRETPGIHQ
ncbi:hypothetical protein BGZ96_004694 [Linnemannia gamsii]|uniref:Uncharacterized protein n=1 Tax=Linnemannia gamsii TaxID=64522 RepID=A0ABQ7JHX1_9FUNG|nr:hypothetical protein BGZ96_004694 [Linnemannia gamsii]